MTTKDLRLIRIVLCVNGIQSDEIDTIINDIIFKDIEE